MPAPFWGDGTCNRRGAATPRGAQLPADASKSRHRVSWHASCQCRGRCRGAAPARL